MKLRYIIVFVFLFYLWDATGGTNSFQLDREHNTMYNLLTDAFLAGKINLPIEPPKELLALSDPYNPAYNWGLRLHDASLYKGKYYLSHGPVPLIFLYIPLRILLGNKIPDSLVVFIFSFGLFIFSVALIYHLKNKYFKRIPEWMLLLSVLVLAFANGALYNLRRADMYEVAISGGAFFLSGALYFLCRSLGKECSSKRTFILASLFLGLSIGCRPQFILSGILLPLVWWKLTKGEQSLTKHSKILLGAYLTIPFLMCLASLFVYNFLRFENPIEFGLHYVLTCVLNTSTDKFFNFENIIPNSYFYFFQLPIINSAFPFIHINYTVPTFIQVPQAYYFEKTVGMFTGIPFILLIFLAPAFYCFDKKLNIKRFIKEDTILKQIEFWIILIPAYLNIGILLIATSVTWRYVMDFSACLILCASLVWFYFYEKINANKLVTSFAVLSAFWSILTGISLGIIGCYDGLRTQDPGQFKKLEAWFKPVSDIIYEISPSWQSAKEKMLYIPLIVTSSSEFNSDFNVNKAFDNNPATSWAARSPGPASVNITPQHPAHIKSIWLITRAPNSIQGWRKLSLRAYLDDNQVFSNSYEFIHPEKMIWRIKLDKMLVNKIALNFEEPFSITSTGKIELQYPAYPGYSEIFLEWE
ncbi:MAG: hypothetical protein HYY52_02835 [Candidatus Melainabacteria bacterium]|nr:hypothetical protein [Candidatus Melainabacteria bacterium]